MAALWKSTTLSISIGCSPKGVYEFVSNGENLPKWAKTFCLSVKRSQGEWLVETPQGPVRIRLAQRNEFGVADHTVTPASDATLFVPMRVVPNGDGSELLFTLFQQPDMSDERYAKDIQLVQQDLETLKRIMETSSIRS